MSIYYNFSKAKFEYELNGICKRNNLKNPVDITEELRVDNNLLEYTYEIFTKNPSVSFIVFSSIDLRTGRVRDKGSDALRVILKWKTRKGFYYKSLKNHKRITSVFLNLEKTIKTVNDSCFNLKVWEFNKDILKRGVFVC